MIHYHHPNLILHPAPLLTRLFSLFYPLMLTIPTSLLQPLLSHLTYLSLLHYLTLLSLDPFKPSCHTSHSITGNSFIPHSLPHSFHSQPPAAYPHLLTLSPPHFFHPYPLPLLLPYPNKLILAAYLVAPFLLIPHPNPLHSSSHIIGQRLR